MIYPEIETLRRMSETFEKMPPDFKRNNNKNQLFFVKGHGFFRKVFPNSNFNYEYTKRSKWFFAGLLILFSLAFVGTIIMWATSLFDNAIYSNLALVNGTETFENWRKPPATGITHFYIFNYTNVQNYDEGIDEKLVVDEVGPYVYEEFMERVNIQFNEDGTVSYQEKRNWKFRPELSKGHRQSDRVVVPNVPLLSGVAHSRHQPLVTRLGFSFMLKGLREKPFLTLPAQRYIFGYDDDLYYISKSILKMRDEKPSEEMGLYSNKLGISQDVLTVNTGIKDINRVGMIERVNGEPSLNHWSTDDCNSFKGTDGTLFPPKLIREKQQVHWFMKQMCRAIPMDFDKEVTILDGQIPGYRYTMPFNIFDTPDRHAENQCFCDLNSGNCPLQGVFNSTPCNLGAPMFISLPHFYKADPILQNSILGLHPEQSRHDSFVVIHPTMGFLMSGTSRFQANIQVQKTFGINELELFHEDEMMLPLAWFEVTLEDKTLPDQFVSIIYKTTFTIKGVELGLKYGCLLTSIVSAICLFIILNAKFEARQRTSSISPLRTRTETC